MKGGAFCKETRLCTFTRMVECIVSVSQRNRWCTFSVLADIPIVEPQSTQALPGPGKVTFDTTWTDEEIDGSLPSATEVQGRITGWPRPAQSPAVPAAKASCLFACLRSTCITDLLHSGKKYHLKRATLGLCSAGNSWCNAA